MEEYRKKPVVITAQPWVKGERVPGVVIFKFTNDKVMGRGICVKCNKQFKFHGKCPTLEGHHIVCPGDWIIKGIKGEFYPCKPDIFHGSYEKITD